MSIPPSPLLPFSSERKEEVRAAIVRKFNSSKCPMCQHREFDLLDYYVIHPMQGAVDQGMLLGGPTLPCVAVVCRNCGHISFHALGTLGLLPPKEEPK
jgi:hypothetical protein